MLSKRSAMLDKVEDSLSILAECSTPALTSLDNRLENLCTTAVHTVTQLISEKSPPVPSKTVFSAQLAERESFVFSDKK